MADNDGNGQGGFIIEKLYSPLFVQMAEDEHRDDYDGDYWGDPMSQYSAAFYEEDIHEALLRERMPDEEPRGLMTYYDEENSVDEKVHSLYVDVEVHGGMLWGVAMLELIEELESGELDTLKNYLTGQYSDGFGEGFKQHEIKVSDGELYVGLWEDGDQFFIDTQRDFERRLGITVEAAESLERVSETPVQVAAYESDVPGEQKVSGGLKLRDMLLLGDMNNVYMVHCTSDVGFVPASYLALLTPEGKIGFEDVLNAKVDEIRPGAYGAELVLSDISPETLQDYDRAAANYLTDKLFMRPDISDKEKPSVMELIRHAREEAKTNPLPQKESPGKDCGPEH